MKDYDVIELKQAINNAVWMHGPDELTLCEAEKAVCKCVEHITFLSNDAITTSSSEQPCVAHKSGYCTECGYELNVYPAPSDTRFKYQWWCSNTDCINQERPQLTMESGRPKFFSTMDRSSVLAP